MTVSVIGLIILARLDSIPDAALSVVALLEHRPAPKVDSPPSWEIALYLAVVVAVGFACFNLLLKHDRERRRL